MMKKLKLFIFNLESYVVDYRDCINHLMAIGFCSVSCLGIIYPYSSYFGDHHGAYKIN